MVVREVRSDELKKLLELYRLLHPEDPDATLNPGLPELWKEICGDSNLYLLAIEEEGRFVSTCTLAVIRNLTRNLRPYALIENVVTHPGFRERGLGTRVLDRAVEIARERGCYKVMLMTGSKKDETLRFYEKAGFQPGVKTGFVRSL
jgi:GNAT superfamily N-acetyltransferase